MGTAINNTILFPYLCYTYCGVIKLKPAMAYVQGAFYLSELLPLTNGRKMLYT